MHRSLVLLVFCLGGFGVSAQESVADLQKKLQAAVSDTARVLIMNDLAFELVGVDNALARKYAANAIRLCGSDGGEGGVLARLNFPKGEASAYNIMGVILDDEATSEQAIPYFKRALRIRESLADKKGAAAVLNNLAGAYESLSMDDSSLIFAKASLLMVEELKDTLRIARAKYGLATKLEQSRDYKNAYKNALDYLRFSELKQDIDGQAKAFTLLGGIMLERGVVQEAIGFYKNAVAMRRNEADTVLIGKALRDLANAYDDADSTDLAFQLYNEAIALHGAIADSIELSEDWYGMASALHKKERHAEALVLIEKAELGYLQNADLRKQMLFYETKGDVLFDLGRENEAEAMIEAYVEIAKKLKDKKFILKSYKDLSKLAGKRNDFKTAFELRKKYADLLEEFYIEEESKSFAKSSADYMDESKQIEINAQQLVLAEQEKRLANDRLERNSILGGAALLGLLTLFVFYRSTVRKRANKVLENKNIEIQAEKQRADLLLANILPEATALELKANNRVKPVKYDAVTVMFTDFKGFTNIAAHLSPEVLVEELDRCFSLLDEIVAKYGIEKIKTIGDAYMCAGGLPIVTQDHAYQVVKAAIEMQKGIMAHMIENQAAGRPVFGMRVGVHTGPVVAGVVGRRKFAYDIWGDAVNTAARMEQSGQVDEVNISEATYQLIKDRFQCTARGRIHAKNMGEIEMFFVHDLV
jgi:adenylate cyclase